MEEQPTMKLVITEGENFSEKALKQLSSKFQVTILDKKSELNHHIDAADILFIRLGINFNEELLSKATKLKVICSPTTGLDHIDLKYCKENGVSIISLKNEQDFLGSIPSTAEHTWTLLQAVNRNLVNAHNHTLKMNWNRDLFKSYNLNGKTIGLLGYGRVGKQVAAYAIAFGMRVIAYDTNEKITEENVTLMRSPEELFSKSDFVSIHIPYEERNINFVNHRLLRRMKRTACLINTSRGKIWDEDQVCKLLLNKKIRGVATDVVYCENSSDIYQSPLFQIDTNIYNCIITPHIAGATFDSMKMTEEFIVNKLLNDV